MIDVKKEGSHESLAGRSGAFIFFGGVMVAASGSEICCTCMCMDVKAQVTITVAAVAGRVPVCMGASRCTDGTAGAQDMP